MTEYIGKMTKKKLKKTGITLDKLNIKMLI